MSKIYVSETENKTKKTYAFFGVCGNYFKLDDKIFEAIEDPDDGYRSYLDTVICVENVPATFSRVKLADVVVVKARDEGNYRCDTLIDASDGHVWLRIGTDYSEDYYPCFVFRYSPKE
jgi:hypothetical protein